MRFLVTGVAALLSICVAAPILAAPAGTPARTQAQCEALSVRRDNGPGQPGHRGFIQDCMTGKISERLSMTYDECERLSEQRGAGLGMSPNDDTGRTAHDRFMSDCLAGRIPRTAPPRRS
jgi:hypothetical protein